MKNKINYKNFIPKKYLSFKSNKNLNANFIKNLKKIIDSLDVNNNIFYSLSHKFKFNFNIKDLQKFRKFKEVVIIGMGGSILGSEAIYSFFKNKIKKDFLFFNDIDDDKLQIFKKNKNLNKILFIVVSKSGNTIETLSNLMALKILKKNSKNLIIITERNNNILFTLTKKMNLYFVEHKKYIGGRFSILSEVGMLPAYLMGLNIRNLRSNLLTHLKSKKRKFLKESVIKIANILKRNNLKNIIYLNYVPKLNKFLYWKQQLVAESLGKKGKGFLPLVSKAPKDHHSLLQLYLDGPKDKLFYIFSSKLEKSKIIKANHLCKNLKFLDNKSLDKIKLAQKNALIQVLKRKKIPFREFMIKDFSEQTFGELISYFILETTLIGKLSNINPFDQPAVEQVKINTKKLLN